MTNKKEVLNKESNNEIKNIKEIKEMEIITNANSVEDNDSEIRKPSILINNYNLNKMEKGNNKKDDEYRNGDKAQNISEELVDEDEDEDEDEDPWIPPSIKEANIYKSKFIYKGGVEKLTRVNLSKEYKELGVGVAIHFLFLRIMMKTFFIMSIMSIPAIIFSFYGTKIPNASHDGLGLYRFMIGNIGYDINSPTYIQDSTCYMPDGNYSSYNGTCFELFDQVYLTDAEVGKILSSMEILQIFVFITSVIYMKRKLTEYRIKNDESLCSIQDFTVMVRNLPLDCTEEKIINHFSNLYSLSEYDWVNRPKLRGAKPVKKSIRQADKSLFKGKWVADCFIYTKIGSYISAFKNKQHLILKLERLTVQQSMYAKNTCHAGGYDPIRLKKVKIEKLKIEKIIDKLTQRMVRAKNLRFEDKEVIEVAHKHHHHHKKKEEEIEIKKDEDKEIKISADPVAAFITFQYSESMARCLEDYEKYSSFPYNIFYPDKLKFEGQRLRIEKSPEPDEILWENLEVSDTERFVLQCRTNLATIILIIVCFALIVQAKIYKDVFRDSLPDLSYCDKIIPQDYLPTYTDIELNSIRLIRPVDQSLRLDLDSQCNNILESSFFAYYVQAGNDSFPLLNYNISSCLNNTQQDLQSFCPNPFGLSFCPCLISEDNDFNTNCGTACSTDVNGINDVNCGIYPLETLGSCACYDFLSDIISTQGISGVFSIISSLSSTDGCYSFMTSYSSATFLSYFAIFITVFINVILQVSLKMLTKLERHASRDSMESSLMTRVFIATYLVLSIVSLVVFGQIESISNMRILKSFQILQGPYNDFNSEWYGDVGSFLLTTFLIKSFQRPLINLMKFWVLSPLKRFMNYSSIRNKSGHKIITQLECNNLAVGSVFDLNTSSSTIMTLLFMAMTYSAGIPMFMPLLSGIFALTLFVDKLLMCRYYQKPPLISEIMMSKIVSLLPFAAVIRMAFAIWMFGNPDVLQSSHNTYADIFLKQTSNIGIGEGPAFIMARILKPNSLPLFCLLCLLLLITISYNLKLHEKMPVFWLLRKIWDVISKSKNTKVGLDVVSQYAGFVHAYKLLMLNDPNRTESAPYSGEYYAYTRQATDPSKKNFAIHSYNFYHELTADERNSGWVVVNDENDASHTVKKKKVPQKKISAELMKLATANNKDNVIAKKDKFMKTYEIVAETGINSYFLENIPLYSVIIRGLYDAGKNMTRRADLHGGGRDDSDSDGETNVDVFTHGVHEF